MTSSLSGWLQSCVPTAQPSPTRGLSRGQRCLALGPAGNWALQQPQTLHRYKFMKGVEPTLTFTASCPFPPPTLASSGMGVSCLVSQCGSQQIPSEGEQLVQWVLGAPWHGSLSILVGMKLKLVRSSRLMAPSPRCPVFLAGNTD